MLHGGISRDGYGGEIARRRSGSREEFTCKALQLIVDEPRHPLEVIGGAAGGIEARDQIRTEFPLRVEGAGDSKPPADGWIDQGGRDGGRSHIVCNG
jgi:hypothetical protein